MPRSWNCRGGAFFLFRVLLVRYEELRGQSAGAAFRVASRSWWHVSKSRIDSLTSTTRTIGTAALLASSRAYIPWYPLRYR